MSLWKRISKHADSEQRMSTYYEERGLLDLRLCLAPWIEDRIMSEQITPNSIDQLERISLKFSEDLQQKLLSSRAIPDPAVKCRIVDLCAFIQRTPSLELYTQLRSGLQKELQLAAEKSVAAAVGGGGGIGGGETSIPSMPLNPFNMNNGGGSGGMMPYVDPNELMVAADMGAYGGDMNSTPRMGLFEVNHLIQRNLSEFLVVRDSLNMLIQSYHYAVTTVTNSPDMDTMMERLHEEKCNITMRLQRSFMYYQRLHETVITELKNWRHNQALAGNGAPFDENILDDIQRCFEQLEVFITHLLNAIKETMQVILKDNVELMDLLAKVQCAQKNLVCSAFIVDKQPPQVMKTNTRFATSVRWLLGNALGIHNHPPNVDCIIMSEHQALSYVTQRTQADVTKNMGGLSSGELTNSSSTMEYQQNSHVFSASFRNMILKKIKRAEKKGTESVMDEKFALFFYATATVSDYQIRVWTLSLPVVVIVHGNQEPQSWATITWDNAFAKIVRDPFIVDSAVNWCKLAVALNTKFGSATQRALTAENMDFLYEKLACGHLDPLKEITWEQFCKTPLPERQFTFWEWFFAIMKLTKEHLLSMWKAGHIMGFINKAKAQKDLINAQTGVGTFLLRFSDSELGGVSIAYVNEFRGVTMLQPWTSKDFNFRNLADRIRDLDCLRWLHPTDIDKQPLPRDQAFFEFYTKSMEQTCPDGYVPSSLRVHLPGRSDDAQSMNGSIMGTPHHGMQSPPQESLSMGNLQNSTIMHL